MVDDRNAPLKTALTILAALWIVTTMTFYAVRFAIALYRTHQGAIDAAVGRIGGFFGAGG